LIIARVSPALAAFSSQSADQVPRIPAVLEQISEHDHRASVAGVGGLLVPTPCTGKVRIFLVPENLREHVHRVGFTGVGGLLQPSPGGGQVRRIPIVFEQ
jgi:hypothetical protein